MDAGVSVAEDNSELAEVEQLEDTYCQLLPMKAEAVTSSSEDDDSEGDFEDFMNRPETEADQSLIEECASRTLNDSISSETAEDSQQDLDERDAFSEPTLENCLYLNHVYQDLIHESIEDVELLLKLNRENQAALNDKIASSMARRTINSRPLDSFSFPYFKDSHYVFPPRNEDAKIKAANCELVSNVRHRRPWSGVERKRLVSAVKSDVMEKALQPVMTRKETIVKELIDTSTLTSKEVAAKTKELETKEIEMKAVQKSVMQNPIGPIDARYDWLKISAVNFEGARSALECELFWKNYLHPSINKSKWGKDELVKLAEAVKSLGRHSWETIAGLLKTNRTALQCFEAFQTFINRDNFKGKWTIEEQERLKHLVETFKIGDYIPWHRVFYFMDGRSSDQVWQHWNFSLNPSIKKGRWTEEEDLLLLTAVWMLGPGNWWKIRDYVAGRTCSQCSERWKDVLNPSLQFVNWSSEEDAKVLELVQKHGGKWSMIARHVPGRNCKAIKTRYISLMNHTTADNTLSKRSEAGFVTFAQNHEIYRKRLYGRLVYAIRLHIKTQGGTASDLAHFSREALVRSISALAVARPSKSRTLEHQPMDKKLNELMCRMSVDDIKKMFYRKSPRKTTAATIAVEKELQEYFRSANQKKRRGRPYKIVEIADDDPEYKNWTEKYTELFQNRSAVNLEGSSSLSIPLLPPMVRSLQSFRGALLRSKSMQALPMSRTAATLPEEDDDLPWDPNDDSYELLFSRFASLFFWPALLSLVKPEEEKPREPLVTKRKRLQKVNEKQRKRRKAAAAANTDGTSKSDLTAEQSCPTPAQEDEVSQAPQKKRGRPRKVKGAEAPAAPVIPSRRSSRMRKSNDRAGT